MSKINAYVSCTAEFSSFLVKQQEDDIRKFGWCVVESAVDIESGLLPMSYTVGLASFGLPEIIVFAVPHESAVFLLDEAAELLRENNLQMDVPVQKIGPAPVVFKTVLPSVAANLVFEANRRAGRQVPVIQLVWPDPSGAFPWDKGYEPRFVKMQPLLYQIPHH